MDDLSRKFRSIDWKGLQKSARRVQASTASALKDMVMTDLENKTRAATADTSWGASGADLMVIAHGTYRREDYPLIMSIVWQRLASSRRRCVYKALDLLKFLIMHGAARCTEEARTALPHLRALTEYVARDEHGRDAGDGVRQRAALVCEMLSDESVLEAERAHSRELRAKLQGGIDSSAGHLGGLSSDDYRYGTGGGASRFGNYGTSDGDGSYDGRGSSTAQATTSTAKFKGYGDDDDDTIGASGHANLSDAYDEEPKGEFSRKAKVSAAVDDLLGGDSPESTDIPNPSGTAERANKIGFGDNDDDDFNPRALTVTSSVANGGGPGREVDDLLAGLGDVGISNSNGGTSHGYSQGQEMTTSQRILQLAAEQDQNSLSLTVVNHNEADVSQAPASNLAIVEKAGDGFETFGNFGDSSDANGDSSVVSSATPTPPTTKKVLSRTSEKEKDPFADLLSTGKQSGML